jgi:hypothetical protein
MTVELLAVAGLVGGEDHGELPVLGHERHLLDQGGSVGKTDGPSRGHPAAWHRRSSELGAGRIVTDITNIHWILGRIQRDSTLMSDFNPS